MDFRARTIFLRLWWKWNIAFLVVQISCNFNNAPLGLTVNKWIHTYTACSHYPYIERVYLLPDEKQIYIQLWVNPLCFQLFNNVPLYLQSSFPSIHLTSQVKMFYSLSTSWQTGLCIKKGLEMNLYFVFIQPTQGQVWSGVQMCEQEDKGSLCSQGHVEEGKQKGRCR